MERIVYILGAGFSAPLGLPVVRNFLFRAKDLFTAQPVKLAHFKEVLDEIDDLARVKNYFSSDLFDIEEILSILEMRAQFDGDNLPERFSRFVYDVVDLSTPAIPLLKPPLPTMHALNATLNPQWAGHASFVAAILNLHFWNEADGVQLGAIDEPLIRYDVVSLNYDLTLERAVSLLMMSPSAYKSYGGGEVTFTRRQADHDSQPKRPRLAKLHGSIGEVSIVPPTWRKEVDDTILDQWRAAKSVLSQANEIRILGYSLPQSDAYIRYLLKAAASEAPNLKKIDVFTLDSDGGTERRFREFISFKETMFVSGQIGEYLHELSLPWGERHETVTVGGEARQGFGINLERVHNRYMGR